MYDIHVATEGSINTRLSEELSLLGFKDDNLVERGMVFNEKTGESYSSCPLIAIHVSQKLKERSLVLELEKEVVVLMERHSAIGYIHSEWTKIDATTEFSARNFVQQSINFKPLLPKPRKEQKVWDMHLSFRKEDLSSSLRESFLDMGFYYISRRKSHEGREGEYAVLTVQGINKPKEGERLFNHILNWLSASNAPMCDAKFEVTTNMQTFRSPMVVPPTIDHVEWL